MLLAPFSPAKYRRRLFGQLWMLALQFILGMILNLLGEETKGLAHAVYETVLVIHILNAIGLVEGAIFIALKQPSRLAWSTAVLLVATLTGGVMTILTEQDAWSFAMALGFVASAWLSGVMYVQADRQLLRSNWV